VVRLDHLSLPVSDWRRSRDWYVGAFGFVVEFELEGGGARGRGVAAIQDEAGLTVFLDQTDAPVQSGQATYALKVDDVESVFARLRDRGAAVLAPPGPQFWGYGAVVTDPDGHVLNLWDEASMAARQ
jgi:predicted enzyme related to lactoylglutathione lyase